MLSKKNLISEYNEDDNEAALRSEVYELRTAHRRQTQLLTADEVAANQIHLEVPKERYRQLRMAMKDSCNSIHLFLDKVGVLEGVEPGNLGDAS